jgi:hypothetical protein
MVLTIIQVEMTIQGEINLQREIHLQWGIVLQAIVILAGKMREIKRFILNFIIRLDEVIREPILVLAGPLKRFF